jgi:hypothetical protein
LLTDFIRQLLYGKAVAFFGAVLPAATFYYSVHIYLPKRTGIG